MQKRIEDMSIFTGLIIGFVGGLLIAIIVNPKMPVSHNRKRKNSFWDKFKDDEGYEASF